jgi:Dyp-type peroxidase family
MAEDANGVAAPAGGDLPLRDSEDIQGNILAPFKKRHQRFLFISFRNQRANARDWLAQLVGVVATTRQVVAHAEDEWRGVSFTASGLVVLDSDLAQDLVAFDAFWQGPVVDRQSGDARVMSPAIVGNVGKGQPDDWVVGGTRQYPVDALLTVAADDGDKLKAAADAEVQRAVTCGLTVLSWQDCERLGQADSYGIESFGFRDGISQPGIRGFTEATVRDRRLQVEKQPGSPIIATGEFVLGYDGEGGSYPDVRRSRVPGWMRDGSFQVFLRLRQDVEGLEEHVLGIPEDVLKIAAARAIGRTPEGVPLARLEDGENNNDFTFEDDYFGEQTPGSAHIRKVNPRDGTLNTRNHRVLRRGLPFVKPLHVETSLDADHGAVKNEAPGLAFNAFMSSIENQFEFLMRHWASSTMSPDMLVEVGRDPLVGASSDLPRQPLVEEPISFGAFVWTSGAVYAFAPSLPELHRLSGLEGDV